MVAPQVLKFFFDPAVVTGKQGVTNCQAFTASGVISYM